MGQVLSACVAPGGRHLLSAGLQGNSDNVREVLETKPELANYTFFNSHYNVMHHAAALGHLDVLRAVVDVLQSSAASALSAHAAGGGGAGEEGLIKEPSITLFTWGRFVKDVMNARTTGGKTPLMLACENGHAACVRYLLEQGADAFAVDRQQRRSAIHYAVAGCHGAALAVLLAQGTLVHTDDGAMPLRDVRVHDMSGQCRYVDSRAENGLTALHMAAAMGCLGCVQQLLAAGASMMVRTVDLDMASPVHYPAGSTPLHLAAQRGHIAILQAMLQAHADALGTWGGGVRGPDGQIARRAWEGDGRIDLRSVTNCLRQLPYHVAWQRGFRQAATVLNPTIAIDIALETAHDLDDGFGPQKLATLAAYALRRNLLIWLETYKVEKLCAERVRVQRSAAALASQRAAALPQQQQQEASAGGAAPEPVEQATPSVLWLSRHQSKQLSSPPSLDGVAEEHTHPQPHDGSSQGASAEQPVSSEPPAAGEGLQLAAEKQCRGRDMGGTYHQAEGDSSAEGEAAPNTGLVLESQEGGRSDSMHADRRGAPDDDGSSKGRSRPPSAKRVGFRAPQAVEAIAGSHSGPGSEVAGRAPSPFQSAPYVSPFASFTTELHPGGTSAVEAAREGQSASAWVQSVQRQKSAPAGYRSLVLGRQNTGNGGVTVPAPFGRTMSERLQELERAIGAPVFAGEDHSAHSTGSGEGSARESEAGSAQPMGRAVSAGLVRMGSASIRRTLGSFRRSKGDINRRLTGDNHSRAASITGFEPELCDDEDCGICLEAELDVSVNGCEHRLCIDCAIRLCEVNKKPPLCPFCRHFIEGFHTFQK